MCSQTRNSCAKAFDHQSRSKNLKPKKNRGRGGSRLQGLNKSYKSIESDNVKRSITLKSTGRTPTLIENVTNKTVYNILRDNTKEAPSIENKLIKYHSEDVDPSLIYSLPYKITKSTTLQCFQFKITHGFYPTNAKPTKCKDPRD